MKRLFSVIITAFVLASGMQVCLDRHYCGGELADIRLSLSGKLASCGMEDNNNPCSGQTSVSKRCCEDQVTFYSLTTNYIPVDFNVSHLTAGKGINHITVCQIFSGSSDISYTISCVNPPGDNLPSALSLPQMCVFRI